MPTYIDGGDSQTHAYEIALRREWQAELRRRGLSSERRIWEIATRKAIYGIRVPKAVR